MSRHRPLRVIDPQPLGRIEPITVRIPDACMIGMK